MLLGILGSAVTSPPSTGLKGWFRADQGLTLSGSNVTAWSDLSGNSNGVTVPTGASSPVLVASAVGGQPAINFNAASSELGATTFDFHGISAGAARSVIAVCTPAAGTGTFSTGGNIFSFKLGTSTFQCMTGNISGTTFVYSNQAASASTSVALSLTGTPAAIELYSAGTSSTETYTYNGVNKALSSVSVATETGTIGFSIGNLHAANTTQYFAGTISEVLVYDHVLSAADQVAIRQYFQTRYGLSLGV